MKNVYVQIQSLAIAACLVFGLQACSVNDILPNAEFNTLMVDANAAMHDNRWDVATSKLEQASRLQPNNLGVKLKQGQVYQQSGKLALAHNTYQQIIDTSATAKGKDIEIVQSAKTEQAKLGFKPIEKAAVLEPDSTAAAPVVTRSDMPPSTEGRVQDTVPLPTEPIAQKATSPQPVINSVDDEAVISARLEAWRLAWQQQRISDYLAFYRPDFTGGLRSHAAWRQQRTVRIKTAKDLQIDISSLQMELQDAEKATVTFTQTYQAANHRDVGLKTLSLQKINNQWLIANEQFSEQ
jgi:tetratricopeptide (TPR) repeat protein